MTDKEILIKLKNYINNKVNRPNSSKYMDEDFLNMLDIIDRKDYEKRKIKENKVRNK